MFESTPINAIVDRCHYAGKNDAEAKKKQNRSARVEITFKIALREGFLEELEDRYFPGLASMINLTADKSRHYKGQLKLNSFGDLLMTILDGSGTNQTPVLAHVVALKNPVEYRCKEGIGHLFLRVEFIYQGTLDILKELDDTNVLLMLEPSQENLFDDVLEAAAANDRESESGSFDQDGFEGDGFGDEGGEDEGDFLEDDEEFPINPEASEKPTSIEEVDHRKSKMPNAGSLLEGLTDREIHEAKQEAAIIAFERNYEKGKIGVALTVNLSDVKAALKQLGLN